MDDAFLLDVQQRMLEFNQATTISAEEAERALCQVPPPSSDELAMFLVRAPNEALRNPRAHCPWWRFWR